MHTKGPWTHDETWNLIHGANGAEVCAIHSGIPDVDTFGKREKAIISTDNAALIASAPDLLEACKLAEDYISFKLEGFRREYQEDCAIVTTARHKLAVVQSAIAKAEGK